MRSRRRSRAASGGLAGRTATRSSQSGYTLVEVLTVVGISGIILVPLFAWGALAMRQQPATRDGLLRIADTGLLGAYFPRDVTVAGAASTAGEECVGGGVAAGEGGSVELLLESGGSPTVRTAYVEAPLADGDTADAERRSIFRRQCAADTGELLGATQVYEDVRPGSTRVTCASEPDDAPCRQIELTAAPASGDGRVVLCGTRRADTESLDVDLTGNRVPTARIRIVSQDGSQPLTVSFSGDGSTDPDGTIVEHRWAVQDDRGTVVSQGTGVEHTAVFPVQGQYSVVLTVVDDKGAQSTTYRRVDAKNRAPVAAASTTPTSGQAGVDTFTFSSAGSVDPDGSIASYRWIVGQGDGLPPLELSGPSPSHTFGTEVLGLHDRIVLGVTLVVTDHQGAVGTAVTSIELTANGDPTDPGGPPTSQPPGAPIARFSAARGSAPTDWLFDASTSSDDGTIVSYLWDFGVLGGSALGPVTGYSYTNPGDYLVTLRVTDDAGLTGVATRVVNVPGDPVSPVNVRRVGTNLVWTAVPGATGYLVDFRFSGPGCSQQLTNLAVAAVPSPSRPIPPNPCGASGRTEARVGTQANGLVARSPWEDLG